ncbi:2-isopropylmalate synthase [Lachnobacterium bovis]|uniref:2-isopropylmalate synthase n=1 Tax=Lachnobacterium bovis DSM 14045 TaxID=1122142 RepID=A0A1H3ME33_9FIRM|nr:2-isopropylmalate synthase [Lachnobacterium bovis]MBQ1802057.1 2-isopropylmalate synthase [Lachnobacterium sp.]SDY74960.1 2-isopropylmalate synthase [Lachnobacterium bovis DSM 14045]
MKQVSKYKKQYFMPPVCEYDWVKKDSITEPPIWCSVDLRDGNQALIEPMSLEEKIEFFQLLVKIGFKEIEVGFPAASETEYIFMRELIERDMIPDDVTVQVLTQAREHIIKKTFEAVKGAPHAIIHLYNSTSVAQREQVFKKDKEQIKKLAVDGAKLLKDLAEQTEGNFSFEYSPESFHGTEVEYAVEVCNAVLDVWQPKADNKAIINIPATVETAMPHVFATQIEYVSKNLKYRDNVTLSLHPHNDRGTGVADAELGVLAGADRLEGTLFGNGERTGNVDLITVAMNMYSHGVEPKLDFTDMPKIREIYERLTRMNVGDRQPYAGNLVFSAFSGSHQDAIAKGMNYREERNEKYWTVPYLPIDPVDVGRNYDADVIRINSQSGKGGVSYILKQNFSFILPDNMKEEVGYAVKQVSDEAHKELSPQWVYEIFEKDYITYTPHFEITECHFKQEDGIMAEATISYGGKKKVIDAMGNGRLDAVSNTIKEYFDVSYELSEYQEHALSSGSSSKAMAYVAITCDGKRYWGAGINEDIIKASIHALTVATNKLPKIGNDTNEKDERLFEILNYMQANYKKATLETLAEQFHLSEPYISKYIKDKSGKNFGEHLASIRMKKAKVLLKNGNMNIENIADAVGYPNVEHFNRLFKKMFNKTPMQYRNESR